MNLFLLFVFWTTKRQKVLRLVYIVKSAAIQLVYGHSTQILENEKFKYNITELKPPTGRRQPVGYLHAWP